MAELLLQKAKWGRRFVIPAQVFLMLLLVQWRAVVSNLLSLATQLFPVTEITHLTNLS